MRRLSLAEGDLYSLRGLPKGATVFWGGNWPGREKEGIEGSLLTCANWRLEQGCGGYAVGANLEGGERQKDDKGKLCCRRATRDRILMMPMWTSLAV